MKRDFYNGRRVPNATGGEMTTQWHQVGDRVHTRGSGAGTIINARKIDIDFNPGYGTPSDGYCYRVNLDNRVTDGTSWYGKAFRSLEFYGDELTGLEER